GGGLPGGRQVEDRQVLTLAKICNQHDLPVGELQRIMVRRRPMEIHLPEAGDLVGRLSGRQEPERTIALDLFFECKFRPREQTDGHPRLARVRKAARDRIWKVCRYKRVADLGGSGRNVVKTVVTHRTPPVCAQPRRRPSALTLQQSSMTILWLALGWLAPKAV